MIFDSLAVKHRAFGDGTVVKSVGNYITVRFENAEKTFVYPDVFEKYLTLADGTVSAEIMNDLAASKAAKQAILDKKNEENLRAMTRGIVIPGKEAAHESEEEESKFKEQENI